MKKLSITLDLISLYIINGRIDIMKLYLSNYFQNEDDDDGSAGSNDSTTIGVVYR